MSTSLRPVHPNKTVESHHKKSHTSYECITHTQGDYSLTNDMILSHFMDPSTHVPENAKITIITPSDALKVFKCKNCTFSTTSDTALKYHFIEMHKRGIKMYKCRSCQFETIRHKNVMDNHSLIHLSEQQITWLECSMCTFRTKLKCNLDKHEMIHTVSEDIKKYKCTECSYKSLWKRDLERHLLKHMMPDQIVKYGCDKCSFSTKHQRYLGVHIQKVYKCTECEFVTRQRRFLKEHVRCHKPAQQKEYACAECPFRTIYKHSITKHSLVHKDPNEVKMHGCEHCQYRSKRRQDLRQHVRAMHEEVKEVFHCETCPYTTKNKNALKIHRRNRRKECLQKHQHVHKRAQEVTFFKCAECRFETRYKWALVRHLARHRPNGQTFESETKGRGSLKRHQGGHSEAETAEPVFVKCEMALC